MIVPNIGDTIVYTEKNLQGDNIGRVGFMKNENYKSDHPVLVGNVIHADDGTPAWVYEHWIQLSKIKVVLTLVAKKGMYLAKSTQCPVCLEDGELEAEVSNVDGDFAWRMVKCGICQSTWDETFQLTSIDEIKVGKDGILSNV